MSTIRRTASRQFKGALLEPSAGHARALTLTAEITAAEIENKRNVLGVEKRANPTVVLARRMQVSDNANRTISPVGIGNCSGNTTLLVRQPHLGDLGWWGVCDTQ